jgi:hypothetical protein
VLLQRCVSQAVTWRHFEVTNRRENSSNGREPALFRFEDSLIAELYGEGAYMSKTLARRIALAERAVVVHEKCFEDCICFPAKEPPFFSSAADQELADSVKCRWHGDRFRKLSHLYIPPWRIEPARIQRDRSSAQFKRAWLASGLVL